MKNKKKKVITQKFREQILENRILKNVISPLNGSRDHSRVAITLLHKIVQGFSFTAGGMYVLDQSENEFTLAHHIHFSEKVLHTLSSIPKDEGLAGFAVKTQKSHQFHISKYPSFLPFRALFLDAHIQTVALIPLIAGERAVGFLLLLSSKKVSDISPRLYSIIGKYLGSWIQYVNQYEEKQQSFQRYEQLISSLSDLIYSRLPDGNFVFISPQIENIIGYKQREVYRNKALWVNIIHPDDKQSFPTSRFEDSRNMIVNEYRILPKGKAEYRLIRDSMTLIRNESQAVVLVNGVLSDITEIMR